MDRVYNGSARIFVSVVQKYGTALRIRLEESIKRRQSEELCDKSREMNKPGIFVQYHNFSMSKKEARFLFRFLKLVILTCF